MKFCLRIISLVILEPDDEAKLDISLCWRCIGKIQTPGESVENSEISESRYENYLNLYHGEDVETEF